MEEGCSGGRREAGSGKRDETRAVEVGRLVRKWGDAGYSRPSPAGMTSDSEQTGIKPLPKAVCCDRMFLTSQT